MVPHNAAGFVIAHRPQANVQPSRPPGATPSDRGIHAFDTATAARLRRKRWRSEPLGRRFWWLVLAITVLLHGVFGIVVWQAMRPIETPATQASQGFMEVRFIETVPAAVKAPSPVPMPPPRVIPKHVTEAPAQHVLSVQLPAKAPTPPPRLFDSNGLPLLPAASSSAPPAAVPEYVSHLPQGDSRIMQHNNPITYRATRFEKDWGHGTNTIDDALQKAVDKTTVKHTFNLPKGIHIHCAVSLAALAGGCGGDPKPPPSPKDGDVRLNMAPAKPLAPGLHVRKPPSLAACIAMYRAGKPLIDGCPSDTPLRAIDQDLHDRKATASPPH